MSRRLGLATNSKTRPMGVAMRMLHKISAIENFPAAGPGSRSPHPSEAGPVDRHSCLTTRPKLFAQFSATDSALNNLDGLRGSCRQRIAGVQVTLAEYFVPSSGVVAPHLASLLAEFGPAAMFEFNQSSILALAKAHLDLLG